MQFAQPGIMSFAQVVAWLKDLVGKSDARMWRIEYIITT
jgi:hypothetical protein